MFKLFFNSTSTLALFERVFAGFSGLLTTYLIYLKFTLELQGFYYTFVAILTVKVLLERFSGVGLVSLVTHEWAKLFNERVSRVQNSNLNYIAAYAVKWYCVAALIAIIFMVIGGSLFFFNSKVEVSTSTWALPWIAIAIISSINVALIPFWIFLEGCGRVLLVFQFRLIQTIFFNLMMWVFIYLDFGLWALPISGVIDIAMVSFFIYLMYCKFFKKILTLKIDNEKIPDFVGVVSKFHWRISVGWVFSFIFINSFVPALFFWQGSMVAGRMGMTWSMIGALLGLANSLSMSKVTLFNLYVAQKKWIELNNLLKKVVFTSLVVMVIGSVFLLVGYKLLMVFEPQVLVRIIELSDFLSFLAGALIGALILPLSIYLRAFRSDPLFYLNLFSSLLGVLGVVVLAKSHSISGVALSFLLVIFSQAAITLLFWGAKIRAIRQEGLNYQA